MKKIVFIARVTDGNSDAYKAYFTREEAVKTAEMYKAHLTSAEAKTHTVSVESYEVEAENATTTAEEAFNEACFNDEIADPDNYEVI